MNQADRDERIVRMKLQTAKILWGENRKDAAFLVMESINDPRANPVREKMFPDNYEARQGKTRISMRFFVMTLFVTILLSFGSGFLFSSGGQNTVTVVTATGVEEQVFTTSIPTSNLSSGADNDINQTRLTGTAAQVGATLFAVQTQQADLGTANAITRTAAYARETSSAQATEAAGQ